MSPSLTYRVGHRGGIGLLLVVLWGLAWSTTGETTHVEDRVAIERVYYDHRLGQKPPFEQVSPPSLIQRLVQEDALKEAALKRAYGVVITPEMLKAEVQRINTTTQAPDMLAEIKAALDNDPGRFAEAFAKPFLVERLLREAFENDNLLHAPQRRACEIIRRGLLAARAGGATPEELLAQVQQDHPQRVREMVLQSKQRPTTPTAPAADEMDIKERLGADAQLLSSSRAPETERQLFFEDLPAELQRVLSAQLRHAGDVSAVIETPTGFLLYVATDKNDQALSTACLSLPKCSYDEWLKEQQ